MSYEIIWEAEGYKIVTIGAFDDGLLQASTSVSIDPRFINAKYGIADFSNVDDFPVHSDTIRQIALVDVKSYKLNPNLKLAIIAKGYVMRSLTEVYRGHFKLNNDFDLWETELFETEDSAREWIDNG